MSHITGSSFLGIVLGSPDCILPQAATLYIACSVHISIEADMRNDSETGLSPGESRDLRRIAGMMIPANAEYGVPGADDPLIFAGLVKSLGRDIGRVRD